MKTRFEPRLPRVFVAVSAVLLVLSGNDAIARPPAAGLGVVDVSSQPYGAQIRRSQDEVNYYLDVAVTGLQPEQVKIDQRGRLLIVEIAGQRQQRMVSPDGSAQSIIRQSQSLRQPVRMPDDGDAGRMQRQNLPGMVRVIIPKRKSAWPGAPSVRPSEDDIRL